MLINLRWGNKFKSFRLYFVNLFNILAHQFGYCYAPNRVQLIQSETWNSCLVFKTKTKNLLPIGPEFSKKNLSATLVLRNCLVRIHWMVGPTKVLSRMLSSATPTVRSTSSGSSYNDANLSTFYPSYFTKQNVVFVNKHSQFGWWRQQNHQSCWLYLDHRVLLRSCKRPNHGLDFVGCQ